MHVDDNSKETISGIHRYTGKKVNENNSLSTFEEITLYLRTTVATET